MTLSPRQFGQFMTPEAIRVRETTRANLGGGHNNFGYGPYDHLATEPMPVEVAARVARYRGANSKN